MSKADIRSIAMISSMGPSAHDIMAKRMLAMRSDSNSPSPAVVLNHEGSTEVFGRIKYVNETSGYGYIETSQNDLGELRFAFNGTDVFKVGQTVSFDVVTRRANKPYATNVTVRTERNVSTYNTEDRDKWYSEGVRLERAFLERFRAKLPEGLKINPQKESNPSAIDFIESGGQYADLKTQNTPFFTARSRNRALDPRYTVTFNRKDYQRYINLYPSCKIYYWVNWTQLEWNNITIQPLEGVWVSMFADMRSAIENAQVALHAYKYRVNDQHNAKDSYLFDLRSDIFTRLI